MDVIVITGAGSGMGKSMVYALANRSCKIIMAGRNLTKLETIRKEVLQKHPMADMESIPIDLSSFASIRAFVNVMAERAFTIRVFINNAGILPDHFALAQSGFEMAMGVNYIGVYYLNRLLLEQKNLLPVGSLILNTVSISYKIGRLNEAAFSAQVPRGRYRRIVCYANSKLALLVYSMELADRLKSRGIRVLAVDPGIVSTGMIAMNRWYDPLTDVFFRPFIKTGAQGADTAVYLTIEALNALKTNDASLIGNIHDESIGDTGKCISNRRIVSLSAKTSCLSRRKWLWNYTEQLLQSELACSRL